MRILITGIAGYLGSIMAEHFLRNTDHEIIGLDSFRYGQASLNHLCYHPRFDLVRGDARDITTIFDSVDAVIPLAAVVGAAACDANARTAEAVNCGAVEELVSCLRANQILLYPNTNSGYGVGDESLCTEESPLKPISLYGRLKVHAEKIVMERENSIAFRLATVFGASPRMRVDLLVNDFTLRACTDRTLVLFEPWARRNFIHVRDVAAAFAHALDNFERMKGQVFNLGDSRANLTKAGLCEAIQRRVPEFTWHNGLGNDPDRRDYLVDNSKLEATGWRPQFTLDDGIGELVKLYRGLRVKGYSNA